MYPLVGRCPVCGEQLHVTRLECGQCGTAIEGEFSLGRLWRLTPQQLEFVEVFLRCEGKLKYVEKELNISYPTVRNRLREIIRALGYEVRTEERIPPEEERQRILDDLAEGLITAEEALELLKSGE